MQEQKHRRVHEGPGIARDGEHISAAAYGEFGFKAADIEPFPFCCDDPKTAVSLMTFRTT